MEKKVILVIDDVSANIDVLRAMLKDNYKVKVTLNGPKGIQIAQKKPSPDLILLDVMMPEMDGYEVCQELKTNQLTRDIPVVFITANLAKDEQQSGLALGAVAYLEKPVDSNKLLETIIQILD